jgi:hypothetical protein
VLTQLPPLDEQVVETAIRARVGELSVCLIDSDILQSQRSATQIAALKLSVSETGSVERATMDKIDDADVQECIVRKTSDWVFPGGGLTVASVVLSLRANSAELAWLRILPSTRSVQSASR